MKHTWLLALLFLICGTLCAMDMGEVPVSFEGRYRPVEVYARLHPSDISDLRVLPSKRNPSDWLPLRTLKERAGQGNFTAYRDDQFAAIAQAFEVAESEGWDQPLAMELMNAYATIAGTVIHDSPAGALTFPTLGQLRAERFYYRYPLVPITMGLYLLGLLLLFTGSRLQNRRWTQCAVALLVAGWMVHTVLLALRCYILARPPVSNMFETLVFVPWVAMLIGVLWNRTLLTTAAIAATLLLGILQITQLDSRLENVQAVLNSHYWLIIHVLMVVSSYAVFILCGLLGHWYLLAREGHKRLGDTILYSMYLGTALLIPGTILGGVWAAQSWGRFWDWDPKESWAFITSCIYLIVIHAYRFNHIGHRGLAMGAILGLLAVSFTWYGVNYILGAGLHSYGFGSGGESVYYLYVIAELVFVGVCLLRRRQVFT